MILDDVSTFHTHQQALLQYTLDIISQSLVTSIVIFVWTPIAVFASKQKELILVEYDCYA
jgi:hypothetical protein